MNEFASWIRANAHPIADLAPIAASLASAAVVGMGEATRFSRETFGTREQLFRLLVERHGLRGLALQGNVRAVEPLDRYARTGLGDPKALVGGLWRPWRTTETVDAVEWIRAFNERHPDDPVRIFGVTPAEAEPSDYDTVLDYVRDTATDQFDAIAAQLTPIRTAHQLDEHVQRHNGIHSGRPFIDHARDALALVDALDDTPAQVRDAMALIVDFHANSVAGRGTFTGDEDVIATSIMNWHNKTGARIAYWDGTAHTAGDSGSLLRARLGTRYASVVIGFHHGDLGIVNVPAAAPDTLDALFGDLGLPDFAVDLREDPPAAANRPARLRVISGIYDPADDEAGYITVDSLTDAVDIAIHIHEATPVHWLT